MQSQDLDVLRQALHAVQASNPDRVVINLEGVDYMDSSGLATLVEAMRNAGNASANYALTVGAAASQSSLMRVMAGDSNLSYLMHKLDGTQTAAPANGGGLSMPRGGPLLSQTDRDGIRAWIDSGAPND